MTDIQDDRPPLWKQLLGAALGGGLALALYYGYDAAKPALLGYLTLPPVDGGRTYDLGAANIADRSMDEQTRKRVVARNIQAAAGVQGQQADLGDDTPIESHSLDINWPGLAQDASSSAKSGMGSTDPVADDSMMQDDSAMPEVGTGSEDAWGSLWKDVQEKDMRIENEERDAPKKEVAAKTPALPNSGIGAGLAVAGAAGGSVFSRLRRKRKE